MKQKDKELLLKDLCARLPYGVKVKDRNGVHTLTQGNTEFVDLFNGKCNIKSFLFPLSSMTEEQKCTCPIGLTNLETFIKKDPWTYLEIDPNSILRFIDWLNKNHFDYRGLIPKGLAIDATGLNIY